MQRELGCGGRVSSSNRIDATAWIRIDRETPEHRAHVAALANPRAHPRLPARRRVGAAWDGRIGRVPTAGAGVCLRRPFARFLRPRTRALRDPLEARGAARLGRPGHGPGLQGADAPRPVADGPARRPTGSGVRRAHIQVSVPDRRRVGGGDRQPHDARGHAHRPRPRHERRLPDPDGRPGEAQRTARERLHGGD